NAPPAVADDPVGVENRGVELLALHRLDRIAGDRGDPHRADLTARARGGSPSPFGTPTASPLLRSAPTRPRRARGPRDHRRRCGSGRGPRTTRHSPPTTERCRGLPSSGTG